MIVKMKMGNNALFSSDAAIFRVLDPSPNQGSCKEKLCYYVTTKKGKGTERRQKQNIYNSYPQLHQG